MMDVAFRHMNIYVYGGRSSTEHFPFSNLLHAITPNRFLLSVIWLLKTPKRQDEKRETECTRTGSFSALKEELKRCVTLRNVR